MGFFIRKIKHWITTTSLLVYIRKLVYRFISYVASTKNGVIVFYYTPEKAKVYNLIKRVKRENEMYLADNEAYQLFTTVRRVEKIKGDIAEVGTYKGGSAKLICEAKGDKILHLFDTFEGLPDLSPMDDPKQFTKGNYPASLRGIKNYLSNYSNVHFYKGLFPSTANAIKNKKFSFVHLDVDLYEPTKAGIEFFYSRMNKGGIIISHDYMFAPGVRKAFDDFFKDKPEPVIEMSGSQCLIVKL